MHVVLLNKRGEVFLQKRSRLKDVHPGTWDTSASGHLDAGEDYETAAARELEEELGQYGAELKRVAKIGACLATGWEFVGLYQARQTGVVRFPCSEIEYGLWIAPEEVDAWIARRPEDFATGFLECWKVWRA